MFSLSVGLFPYPYPYLFHFISLVPLLVFIQTAAHYKAFSTHLFSFDIGTPTSFYFFSLFFSSQSIIKEFQRSTHIKTSFGYVNNQWGCTWVEAYHHLPRGVLVGARVFDEQLARKLCVEPIHLLEPTEFRSSTRVGSSNWEPVSGTPGFANTLKCHELVVFTP